MARNPVALLFPCHRVVDASGALHNYGYGVEVKARILQMEGYVRHDAESLSQVAGVPSRAK
jgi:methylated-DNA-[protein]-cysteine S-methyltransferase